MEMYCLSVEPAVKVNSFDECRDTSEDLSGITMTVSYYASVPTAFPGPNGTLRGSDPTILNMLRKKFGFEYIFRRETIIDVTDNATVGQILRVCEPTAHTVHIYYQLAQLL
jgi:hypothetical protein